MKTKPEPKSTPVVETKTVIKTEQAVPKLSAVQIKKESREEEATLKISELLLKGYKMLNATCDQCGVSKTLKKNWFNQISSELVN